MVVSRGGWGAVKGTTPVSRSGWIALHEMYVHMSRGRRLTVERGALKCVK